MMPARANEEEIAQAWARYAGAREKATFRTTNLLIALLLPAWSAFDFILEPNLALPFLALRIADVLLTLGIWAYLARSEDVQKNRAAMWISVVAVGVTIAIMLPQVPEHYALYAVGFSLVFWGCGLVLLYPVPYMITSFAAILAVHVALHFTIGERIDTHQFVGSFFYLASAAIISSAHHVTRLRLEREAFRASFVLEQQNAELAATLARLEETQTRLNATGAALTESLDVETTAQHVVSLSVPAFASWAVLTVMGRDDSWISAAEHVDPAVRDQLLALISSHKPELSELGSAIRIERATEEDLARALGPGANGVVKARSLLIAPLIARGNRIGLLVFGRIDRDYAPNEVVLVEEVARRAALALDNARLFREAQEAVRARDEFISVASHELRTPLTPLKLTIDGLLRSQVDRDRTQGSLQRAERQVARLSALVDQLLDVTRLAEGRLMLELEELDLAEVVRDVVNRFQADADRNGCALEVVLARAPGKWDRSRLDQILSNLVSNAIKYGSGAPIRISLARTGDRVELSVRDHGIGIAAADHARIFERFVRTDGAKNYGGFGLGLWIAKKLVEQMAGTIRVESELEQGATFVVDLPLEGASTPELVSSG